MFNVKQLRQLKARLKPDHVRERFEDGITLHYLEGWHVIAEANRIFGFDGWSRETVDSSCVYTKRNGDRYEAVYTARIRIIVEADGRRIVREGSGTGEANTASPGQAHEFALKAAETDATKRALMTFGNAFGLSLYAGSAKPTPSRQTTTRTDNQVGRATETNGTGGSMGREDGGRNAEQGGRVRRAAAKNSSDNGDGNGRPVSNMDEQEPEASSDNGQTASLADDAASSEPAHEAEASITQPNGHDTRSTGTGPIQARIDKSTLTLSEPKRLRDPDHLKFVARQPCLVCGRNRAQAHHITFAQPNALGRKVSDEFTVPLCSAHHRELHHAGNEMAWWEENGIEPLPIAHNLWRKNGRSCE